jgi:hypothetical protein
VRRPIAASDLVASTTDAFVDVTVSLGRSQLMGFAKSQASLRCVRVGGCEGWGGLWLCG